MRRRYDSRRRQAGDQIFWWAIAALSLLTLAVVFFLLTQ